MVTSNALARKIDSICEKGGMKQRDIALLLDTNAETVSRWNQGRNYPHPRTETILLELEYLIDQLSDFYEPNEARLWMFSPQKHLKGKKPADLIKYGRIDDVKNLVNQLRESVHG